MIANRTWTRAHLHHSRQWYRLYEMIKSRDELVDPLLNTLSVTAGPLRQRFLSKESKDAGETKAVGYFVLNTFENLNRENVPNWLIKLPETLLLVVRVLVCVCILVLWHNVCLSMTRTRSNGKCRETESVICGLSERPKIRAFTVRFDTDLCVWDRTTFLSGSRACPSTEGAASVSLCLAVRQWIPHTAAMACA